MKKIISTLVVFVFTIILGVGCSKGSSNSTDNGPKEGEETATYTFYNTTGKTVTDLYVYEEGSSDKGDNYAKYSLKDKEKVVVNKYATPEEKGDKVYIIEFKAEGEDTQYYETLHFEVAPVSLKSQDGLSGATPISFTEPE